MKLCKLLILITVVLLVATSSYTVGEGSWECLWGTGCTGSGGNSFRVGIRGTLTVGNYDNGTYCFSIDPVAQAGVNPITCTTQVDAVRSGGGMVTSATYIGTCFAFYEASVPNGWNAGDLMEVQVVEIADGGGGAVTTIGDKFTFLAPADSCAGATNCADATGVYEWTVDGTTSGGAATLGIRIEDSAGDPDADNSARMNMAFNCSY
jgi:hypothetical protein